MTQQVKDEEFIELWNAHASVTRVAEILGINHRWVNHRRRNIEKRQGIQLLAVAKNSPDFNVTLPANGVRVNVGLESGVVIVGSDAHYWPGIISTAHRAFIVAVKELNPKMVVMNGDAFDGANISRHPRT